MRSQGLEARETGNWLHCAGLRKEWSTGPGRPGTELHLLSSMLNLVSVWHRDLEGMQSGSRKTT